MSNRVWRKSSYSEPNGNECVEVAHSTEDVGVRDSKHPTGPKLRFSRPDWLAFVNRTFRAG